jgi:hypothetical protein
MGVMTRQQMATEVEERVNRSDIPNQIDTWLYRAVLDLSTYRQFYENRKLATLSWTTNDTVAAPSDFYAPIRLEYDNGSSIDVIAYKDIIFVRNRYSSTATGIAEYYARVGDDIYFDRDADQTYSLSCYYKYRPADFTGDSDTSPYGGEWDEAIILWAVATAFARLREWELSDFHKKQYYAYVKGRLGAVEEAEEAYNESFTGDPNVAPFTF